MCGIGGLRGSFTFDDVVKMMKTLEFRGKDAIGILTGNGVIKATTSASNYLNKCEDKVRKLIQGSDFVLLHTRLATTGDTKKVVNAHPFGQDGFALAHNGCMSLWEATKKKIAEENRVFVSKEIETDSYIILLSFLDKLAENKDGDHSSEEAVLSALKEANRTLTGSMACWLHNIKDEKTFLFRNSNPLFIGGDKDKFAFASGEYSFPDDISKESIREIPMNELIVLDKGGFRKIGALEKGYSFEQYQGIYIGPRGSISHRVNPVKLTREVWERGRITLGRLMHSFLNLSSWEASEEEMRSLIRELNVIVIKKGVDIKAFMGSTEFSTNSDYYRFLSSKGFTISPTDNSVNITQDNIPKFFRALKAIQLVSITEESDRIENIAVG